MFFWLCPLSVIREKNKPLCPFPQNVHSLLSSESGASYVEILEHCTNITKALHRRILQQHLDETRIRGEHIADEWATISAALETGVRNQITVSSYLRESLNTAIDLLKTLLNADNEDAQQGYNLIFEWISALFDVAELVSVDAVVVSDRPSPGQIAHLVRYFRNMNGATTDLTTSHWQRRMYLQLLHVMCRWLALLPKWPTESEDICLIELHIAVLDYPLRHRCDHLWTVVHDMFVNYCSSEHYQQICLLLKGAETFAPAVAILCAAADDHSHNDPLLTNSLAAIETLAIHQSVPLCERIFKRIIMVQPQFAGNAVLRANGELLLLRLLSHLNLDIRRTAYILCAVQMNRFFAV